MQKLSLTQSLGQKLSPQQIQFIKLLQIPTAELDSRVEEELEINPALEEGKEEPESEKGDQESEEEVKEKDEIDIEDYLNEDDYGGYKMHGDGNYNQEEEFDIPISSATSLHEQLISQLGFLKLDERQTIIGRQLIGSIEADGYIRRDLEAILNDIAFSQNIYVTLEELEVILDKIQNFEPLGIAARNLQECLLLQLERREFQSEEVVLASRIISGCFDEFTKKHYDKIVKKLGLENEELFRDAINAVIKLNPKPGGTTDSLVKTHYLTPDFLLTNDNGKLDLTLNSRNAPELKISRTYSDMFESYSKSDKKDKKLKETVTFVKQKLDAAKWFIDAIKQRQQTLLNTMNAIIEYQYEFFLDGDESKLKPMILKHIAEKISMDISTISRVANSKAIQTEFGIYPLKYFFSEGIATDSGEDVSSREVKLMLKEYIEAENKSKPLSDDKLEKMLNAAGYNIARRTVAKYREQMNLPVARLRKELK
ncbi:MAG: RNA polymerase factor sigma-54 [Cyclobacteriaceae bacterium]|jgi:RNA polymerase sigma-54 factor|nr:RNA polymerase factor sigma-54 [Cyclobacteriaceae bacterium]